MKTMSILLCFYQYEDTWWGVTHKNVRCGSYITIWQDIVFSSFIIFNNKCIHFSSTSSLFHNFSFINTHTVSQLT